MMLVRVAWQPVCFQCESANCGITSKCQRIIQGLFETFRPNFQYQNEKKMFNWQEAIFKEIVDVKKLLVGCQSFCLHSFISSDCKWHGTVKETTCSVSGLLFYFRDLRHNCTLHKLSEVQIAFCPQTVSWRSLL